MAEKIGKPSFYYRFFLSRNSRYTSTEYVKWHFVEWPVGDGCIKINNESMSNQWAVFEANVNYTSRYVAIHQLTKQLFESHDGNVSVE